jgi:hypothetical protein
LARDFLGCGIWGRGIQQVGDLLLKPVFFFEAMLEAYQPAAVGILLFSLSHGLGDGLFSLSHDGDDVLGLTVLFRI